MIKNIVDIDFNNVQMRHTRDGYGEGLLEAAGRNSDIVAIGADITASTKVDMFRGKYPERFISLGIAEQNQMCVAAGLSLMGKIPYISNYTVFLVGRAWDQIRTTVCYNNLNVKLGGAHSGISASSDGATHQALEDVALMRCLPNMKVVVPADWLETKKATMAAADMPGPVYIRFGREIVPVLTHEDMPFEIGKAYCCREGTDVVVIACGVMVFEALAAAEKLAGEGISVMVINCHTVKPIDAGTIIEAARITGAVVTAEEHQVMGGMGSAVLEVLAQNMPVPVKMVGIQDRFGESGATDVLMRELGLTGNNVAEAVKSVLKMRNQVS